MLQAMLTDTPLVKNLDNDEYMKILLDGSANRPHKKINCPYP